ncbi:MAG TPA: hypothetical protein VEB03_00070 [Candidatus Nanoarchaeia archaeon]|nr:hypothetical protein [Candidatus Nanoarchaeia archaeon]
MKTLKSIARSLPELSFSRRVLHCLLLFGLPLFLWDLLGTARTARNNELWGTQAITASVVIAALGAMLAAVFFAVLEHAMFAVVRRRQQ